MLSEKPWNVEKLIFLLVSIFFGISVVMLTQAGLEHFLGKARFAEGSLAYLVIGSLALHGSILFGFAVVLGIHKVRWRDAFGFNHRPLAKALVLGMMLAFLFLPVGLVFQDVSMRVLEKIHMPAETQKAVVEFEKAQTWGTRAYLIFFAVALAPIAEEMFFRGTLYPVIKQLGFPKLAAFVTSILFAAVHLAPGIFLPLVILSFVLIWLYEKTDNLLAPIAAHAAFNGINIIRMYYQDDFFNWLQKFFHH